jgi:hypothetical protein
MANGNATWPAALARKFHKKKRDMRTIKFQTHRVGIQNIKEALQTSTHFYANVGAVGAFISA